MDETQVSAAPVTPGTAPAEGETASPVAAPVSGEHTPESQTPEPAKTFTQEEVNAIVAKEKSKVERKAQRERDRAVAEAASRQQPIAPAQAPLKPTPDKFTTTEDYVEALAAYKAEEIVGKKLTDLQKQGQEAMRQRQQHEAQSAFREREDAAREKYADFDEVAYNPALPITDAMAETIQQADNGTDLAYYLGKNPSEAARIAKLSPFLQAKELGRLEAKLPASVPAKKVSAAPEPFTPVNGKGGGTPVMDSLDPKFIEKFGASAFIAAERERQRKKWEQRNR